MSSKSVAIIVNSSEIDEKSQMMLLYLKKQLIQLSFIVKEANIYKDISEIVKTCEIGCDILLITGKLNVISNALCNIFKENIIISKHLASVYNDTQNIVLPKSSQIFQIQDHANGINPICIKYRNIFILPDDLLSVKTIISRLLTSLVINVKGEVYGKRYVLKCDQNGRVNNIKEKIKNYKSINVTHFCVVNDDNCQLNVILQSCDFKKLLVADEIIKMFNRDVILSESITDNFWSSLDVVKNEKYVQEAVRIITECYTNYKPTDVFLSFNGGKDCTVLLYLTAYVLKKLYPEYNEKLLCMYIQSENPFKEVEDFIEDCKIFYNLEVTVIKNSVKIGLGDILKQHQNLKACLIGTRRTDPYSQHLSHFQMTDPDWPQVMRVSPILDWKYSEIWEFLLKLKIPYCNLYDLGYTSLGSKTNTTQNPALQILEESSGMEHFMPAYKLEDGSKERCGRFKL